VWYFFCNGYVCLGQLVSCEVFVVESIHTTGSEYPMISKSSTCSSWLCAFGFGDGLHDPVRRTAVPVESLYDRMVRVEAWSVEGLWKALTSPTVVG
jgi:hypothetical protein